MRLSREHKLKRAEFIQGVIIPFILQSSDASPERAKLLKKWAEILKWYVMEVPVLRNYKRTPRKIKKSLARVKNK